MPSLARIAVNQHELMNRSSYLNQVIVAALIIFAVLACHYTTTTKTTRSEPKAAVAPITIGSDLARIDLCRAIPKEDIEAVMGRKLINAPKHFEFYETAGTSGCTYDGGKDADGEAHYGYVVLTPLDVYDKQPLYKNVNVGGIGDSAYFNNGGDTRQLWVRMNGKVAFVVGFGDIENEDCAKSLAKLVVAAIK
jgi:hypothetical protein